MRNYLMAGLIALSATVSACGKPQMRGSGDTHTITSDQIAQTGLTTAYDVIQRLHPQWLYIRAPRSLTGGGPTVSGPGATDVVVYIDGVRAGDQSALKSVPANSVESLKYLDASEATSEHGTGHLYGSIEVRTRHGN